MKHINLIVAAIIFFALSANAQQLANSTHIPEARTAWNPAFTATGDRMITDGFFRMQWLGFAGAPVSGFASFQYPLERYNMSGGALLHFDKTGPVSKLGVQLNYAYKIKQILGRYSQLSLGISGNFQQYSFNGSGQVFNDEGDVLVNGSRASSFFPSLGGGFYFLSSTREYKENTFFAGAAVSQVLTTKVLISDLDQVRQMHIHFNIGGRFYNYDSFLEPMLTANLVKPDIIDVLYSLKYERQNAFWAGLGYASSGMAAFQGGVILDEFGSRYGNLRIGVLGNYGIKSSLAKTGPGMEFYIGYASELK